jgi:serine/threonine protein kinase
MSLTVPHSLKSKLMSIEIVTGTKLNNKYKILEQIGQGGKSIVYKAQDLELGKIVACKILLSELLDDEINFKRFRQEAIAAKRLEHQNINSVSDFGEWNGQPFMIMEYLEGRCLAELLDSQPQLPIKDALSIFIQIAQGCAYAHARNIIHRDLKPSNVMILSGTSSNTVKIIDFGIAKIVSENTLAGTKLTKTGDIFGSPLYMSPEQCMGKTVDLRSDIYSLGTLMYEVLTGKPPLEGPTAMVTIFKHTKEMPAKFGNIGVEPKYSQAIENIVFKCLAKDPRQRFQKMEEILEACSKILDTLSNKITITK